MTAAAQGTDIIVAFKKQSALGTPASGSGGTGIEVRPAAGLTQQIATIQSTKIRSNLMRKRPRQGSVSVQAQYETELEVGNCDGIFAGVLGGTTATFDVTEADVTSVTITGATGAIVGASGSFITKGVMRGMMVKFASLSVSGNNGIWVPVLDVTASQITTGADLLVDNATDTAFTMTVAKSYSTPTPRPVEYYTFEEYLGSGVDASKLGSDLKFTSLNFGVQPNAPTTIGFGLSGLRISNPTGASAPTLTSPTFPTTGGMLVMLDGAIYNGTTKMADLTGFTAGLSAQASITPLITSRYGTDVVLGMFEFAGQFTSLVEDSVAFAAFLAETQFSIFARFSEREADPADFVSLYVGDCAYGGWNAPIADGQIIQTTPIYAGSDGRGAGSIDSTMVISTSST